MRRWTFASPSLWDTPQNPAQEESRGHPTNMGWSPLPTPTSLDPNPRSDSNSRPWQDSSPVQPMSLHRSTERPLDTFDRELLALPDPAVSSPQRHQRPPALQERPQLKRAQESLNFLPQSSPYFPRRALPDASFIVSTPSLQPDRAHQTIPPSIASSPLQQSHRAHQPMSTRTAPQPNHSEAHDGAPGLLAPEDSPRRDSSDPFNSPSGPRPAVPPIGTRAEMTSPTIQHLERRRRVHSAQGAPARRLGHQRSPRNEISLHHAPPIANGIPLVSPSLALPDKLKQIFPYDVFNAAQSKCFPAVYESNDNVVVSAPTGSGKTAILELAICRLIAQKRDQNFKIIYLAPTKALCWERAKDWEAKFGPMNMHCAELTGDTSSRDMYRVKNATIIVSTPEKWDSITRKWEDHHRLLQLVRLFLIDEVHILKDSRGATLEAVVSRMKTIGANVRLVALGATIPNPEDIATWLGRDHTTPHLPARRETFGEEMRPVKLKKFVYGFDSRNMNPYAFDKLLESKLHHVLQQHVEGKPIMVFCFTRKSCQVTASLLANLWVSYPAGEKPWPSPSQRIPLGNSELQENVKFGVAFHHGGLDAPDRQAVERGFLSGQLGVICCTSTLAVGVNLPCHTVILKGTAGFSENKVQEYSDLEVMQMLGRAGRPQFDDSATGIILTTKHKENRYKQMISGQEVLESTLHKSLIGHLNSEVVLRTIRDIGTAKTWLKGTFLHVRMRQHPRYYGIANAMLAEDVDAKIEEICERDINNLQDAGLISEGARFHSTEYGRAMAKYMIEFGTMKGLLAIPRGVEAKDLLKVLCHGTEFQEFRFRAQEKAVLKELNKAGTIPYPLKENLTEAWAKAFILVQVFLSGVEFPHDKTSGFVKKDLTTEKNIIFDRMKRLVRCVVDCKASDSDAVGARVAMELSRSLSSGCWDGRSAQLLQIPSIGPVSMRKLTSHNVTSIKKLAELQYSDIERIMSRNPPFGKNIKDKLRSFPFLTLEATVIGRKVPGPRGQNPPSITVKARIGYRCETDVPTGPTGKIPSLTFVAETADGVLRYFWRDSIRKVDGQSGLEFRFPVTIDSFKDNMFLSLSCEDVVGTEVTQHLCHDIPEAQFPPTPVAEPSMRADAPRRLGGVPDPDEFADCELSDEDLLAALADTADLADRDGDIDTIPDRTQSAPRKNHPAEPIRQHKPSTTRQRVGMDSRGRPRATEPEEADEPVRLPNGRWMCNHPCAQGKVTKSGRRCTHKCCHEGLEKPRKKPRRKSRLAHDNGIASAIIQSTPAMNTAVKRTRPLDVVRPAPERLARVQPTASLETLNGVEYFDLTMFDDDMASGWSHGKRQKTTGLSSRPMKESGGGNKGSSGQYSMPRRPASAQSSHYDSDMFDDDDELPDIQTLLSRETKPNKENASGESRESAQSSHPSTRFNFQKAGAGPIEPLLGTDYDMGVRGEEVAEEMTSEPLSMASVPSELVGAELLATEEDRRWEEQLTPDPEPSEEPSWVSEFDPDIVNLIRGVVEFTE